MYEPTEALTFWQFDNDLLRTITIVGFKKDIFNTDDVAAGYCEDGDGVEDNGCNGDEEDDEDKEDYEDEDDDVGGVLLTGQNAFPGQGAFEGI